MVEKPFKGNSNINPSDYVYHYQKQITSIGQHLCNIELKRLRIREPIYAHIHISIFSLWNS